jgi:hypothetical protein
MRRKLYLACDILGTSCRYFCLYRYDLAIQIGTIILCAHHAADGRGRRFFWRVERMVSFFPLCGASETRMTYRLPRQIAPITTNALAHQCHHMPILPTKTQIFVTCTFYIFVTCNHNCLVGQVLFAIIFGHFLGMCTCKIG